MYSPSNFEIDFNTKQSEPLNMKGWTLGQTVSPPSLDIVYYSQLVLKLTIITRPGAVGSGPITDKHIYPQPFIPRCWTIYPLKSA